MNNQQIISQYEWLVYFPAKQRGQIRYVISVVIRYLE